MFNEKLFLLNHAVPRSFSQTFLECSSLCCDFCPFLMVLNFGLSNINIINYTRVANRSWKQKSSLFDKFSIFSSRKVI